MGLAVEVPPQAERKMHSMSPKILVTYATRAGSTGGVARGIGAVLARNGFQVLVKPLQEISDISDYDAVVMGSAIQNQRWLPEALDFLQSHRAALRQKPFAAFLVCITMSMKNPRYHSGVREWLQPVRALVPPMQEGYFAGMLKFDRLPLNFQTLLMRGVVLLRVWRQGDHRDWDAINAWAQSLAERLHEHFQAHVPAAATPATLPQEAAPVS